MKRKTNKVSTIVLGAIMLVGLASCGGSAEKTEATALSGDVKIDGSSTVYPITEAVAEEFRKSNPNVQVTIGSSGTGAGFKKFIRNEVAISDASRVIKDEEAASCKEAGIAYTEIMIAYDGLAIITNKENTWLTNITVDELKKIWEPAAQGVIKKWNQINPAWPNEEIHLYGPSTAHGTYDYFTEAINGKSGASRGDFTACADYNVLVQGVSSDKFALGYVGLAFFEENADKLKLIGVDGGKGAIIPSAETVANGTYAPLSRSLYIYINNEALKKAEVKSFVDFYISNAATLSKEVGYVALPAEKYEEQKNKLK